MEWSSVIPLLSMMLLMFLVVWTGTAWFIALHPGFVLRIIHRSDGARAENSFDQRALRLSGVLYGAVGLALIILNDMYT